MRQDLAFVLLAFGLLGFPIPASAAAHCRLSLTSQPTGATIYIDGRAQGKTPKQFKRIPAGQRLVSFALKGHRTVDRLLPCQPGRLHKLNQLLQRVRGYITIKSTPPKAQVRINGKIKGYTPLLLPLKAGRYRLELRKYRFAPISHRLNVDNAGQSHRHFTLTPHAGRLAVTTSPPGANVYKGTTFIGRTPFHKQLPAGMHTLVFQRKGYTTTPRIIEVPPLGVQKLHVVMSLQASKGTAKQLQRHHAASYKALLRFARRLKKLVSSYQNTDRTPMARQIKALELRLLAKSNGKPASYANLARMYTKAAWFWQQESFRFNDTVGNKPAPGTRARQQKAREQAQYYRNKALIHRIYLLKRMPIHPLATMCEQIYKVGLALRKRKRRNAAMYPFQMLISMKEYRACNEAQASLTRVAQLYLASKAPSSQRKALRYLKRAMRAHNNPLYAMALYERGMLYKRKKQWRNALPLLGRAIKRCTQNRGTFESQELRLWLLEKATQQYLLTYARAGDIHRAKANLRKWGGKKRAPKMWKMLQAILRARKRLQRK